MPRSSFGLARAGDRLFVMGGHTGIFHEYLSANFTNETLELYIPTRKWRRLAPMPVPLQGFRAVVHGGFVYSFGGFRYDSAFDYGNWGPHEIKWAARSDDRVFRYDIARDTWSFLTTMPRRRSSNEVFKVGTKVYLVAGWDGTPKRRGDRAAFIEAVDVFDLATEQFLPNDAMLLRSPLRRAAASCEFEGKLVLLGGIGQTNDSITPVVPNVTVFDPVTGMFDDRAIPSLTSAPCLDAGLFSPGACVLGDRIVVAGGNPSIQSYPSKRILTWKKGDTKWTESNTTLSAGASFLDLVPLSGNRALIVGGHGDDYPTGWLSEVTIP